jgi:hypothetical protein
MFLFYLPGFVWRNLNKACGINTKIITKMVTDMDQLDGEKRENAVRALAKHIDKALAYHREYEYGFMYVLFTFFSLNIQVDCMNFLGIIFVDILDQYFVVPLVVIQEII